MAQPHSASPALQLFSIRNHYRPAILKQKQHLLNTITPKTIKGANNLKLYYEALLFLSAYPDNVAIYKQASDSLETLKAYIQQHDGIEYDLYNSGVTGSRLCATFSFEMVRWLHRTQPENISVVNVEADDEKIQAVMSVALPKVESEILQDANEDWKSWLNTSTKKIDLLPKLIDAFEQSDLRPEVKDELWDSLGLDIEITFTKHTALPASLVKPFYHKSIVKKHDGTHPYPKPVKVKLNQQQAGQIIECGRIVLARHLREIDPVTFTSPELVSYYQLSRGISVALMSMVPDRRHPIDSYMGYVAFKNGLPVAYAGSWLLFDSGRIGLNIFPAYRGGESRYLFEEIIELHRQVYNLKRFTADPYQIGKHNSDGIKSGAFWFYYYIGFRPVKEEQKRIAGEEYQKIKKTKGYRTPAPVLEKLADSRVEWERQIKAVHFDATDISRVFAAIVKKRYNNNRKLAQERTFKKLVTLLGIPDSYNDNFTFIVKNWCVLLMENETELKRDARLRGSIKKFFRLKADGDEELAVSEMQKAKEWRKLMEGIVKQNLK